MTIRIILLAIICTLSYCQAKAQSVVDVAENTLKVKGMGEEVFYYGFAEGDKMIFNFEEVNGKELKEIEIIELPGSSKFMDYKTSGIENKTILINKTGIYKFRFANSAIGGRICKFKIQRIPASNVTQKFNSSVYWRTVNDTIFSVEKERYVAQVDTIVSDFFTSNAKVHSKTNSDGNKTVTSFTLPENTVAWSYYLGVDQSGEEQFSKATQSFTQAASPMLTRIPNYGPLAALALTGVSYFSQAQKGEAVNYYIADPQNSNLFLADQAFNLYKKNKAINDYCRMQSPLNGTYCFCFSNDNMITGVNVLVKVTAIVVNKQYAVREVQRFQVNPKNEPYLQQ